jgi:hypothetical protein
MVLSRLPEVLGKRRFVTKILAGMVLELRYSNPLHAHLTVLQNMIAAFRRSSIQFQAIYLGRPQRYLRFLLGLLGDYRGISI